jgi:hypothetical protein
MRIDKSDPAPPEVLVNECQVPLLTKEWATPEGPDKLFPEDDFSAFGLPEIPAAGGGGGLAIRVRSPIAPVVAILTTFDALDSSGIPIHEADLYIFDSQTRDLTITTDGDDVLIRPNEAPSEGIEVVVLELSYGLSADDLARMPQYDLGWSNRASYGARLTAGQADSPTRRDQ